MVFSLLFSVFTVAHSLLSSSMVLASPVNQGLWLTSKTDGSVLDSQTCLSRETSPTSRPCLFSTGNRVKIGKFAEELLNTVNGGKTAMWSWSYGTVAHTVDPEFRELRGYLVSLNPHRTPVKIEPR